MVVIDNLFDLRLRFGSENTAWETRFCPLKCSLEGRILQFDEPSSYCVRYSIDDAFEEEVDTEMVTG